MKRLLFPTLLFLLLGGSSSTLRAQFPNLGGAIDKAKEIIDLVKSDTASNPPPAKDTASSAPSDKPLSLIEQTIQDILADTSNVDDQGARDTIALYVDRRTSGYGGTQPLKPAAAYASAGAAFFVTRFYDEAIYCYAKAAMIEPQNAEWLNNLASALLEREKTDWAKTLLIETIKLFPNLDPPMGNLAAIDVDAEDNEGAIVLLEKAISLSPNTGLYHYLYGKALDGQGNKSKAKKQYALAWQDGYAGSGREGDPSAPSNNPKNSASGGGSNGSNGNQGGSGSTDNGSSGDAAPPSNNSINSSQEQGIGDRPPHTKPSTKTGPIPTAWVGHYEADYVRGKTLRIKQYGAGMTGTNVREDVLACAKSFSLDIYTNGSIAGQAKVMYVYLGKAVNPSMAMAPGFMIAKYGDFMATLKNGSQILNFDFTGRVDAKGNVEIDGMPSGQLDLYNAGEWQKIGPWNVLPPPDNNPRGPALMKLATGTDGIPTIYINRLVHFSSDMSLTYQAYIKKTDDPVTCDCKLLEPPPPSCPQSEYLKAKVSVSNGDDISFETSQKTNSDKTTPKVSNTVRGEEMAITASIDADNNISLDGNIGVLVGSQKYNLDNGNYQMTVGIGINNGFAIPGVDQLSQKVELIYDNLCGWGFKGTAKVTTSLVSAGVEGVIFFNRGK